MWEQQPKKETSLGGCPMEQGGIVAPISMPIQLSEWQCHPPRKGIIRGRERLRRGPGPWGTLETVPGQSLNLMLLPPSLPALRCSNDHWMRTDEER